MPFQGIRAEFRSSKLPHIIPDVYSSYLDLYSRQTDRPDDPSLRPIGYIAKDIFNVTSYLGFPFVLLFLFWRQ